jgi:hypothetical protein
LNVVHEDLLQRRINGKRLIWLIVAFPKFWLGDLAALASPRLRGSVSYWARLQKHCYLRWQVKLPL